MESAQERRHEGRRRIWLGGTASEVKRVLRDSFSECTFPAEGPVDLVVIAASDVDEAAYFCAKHGPRLSSGGEVWVVMGGVNAAGSTLPLAAAMTRVHFPPCGQVELGEKCPGLQAQRFRGS